MFLSNKYSGVDFRERKIAFATMKLDKDLPMVLSLTTIDSNHKIIDGGRLTHSETTTSDLRKILSNKDVSKLLHIAIPTQFTLVRKINSLPDLGEVELSRLLQFQIGESIHLPFEEPVYDFVKIGSIQPEKTQDEDLESLAGATDANLKGPRSEILFLQPLSRLLKIYQTLVKMLGSNQSLRRYVD
ncbi:hypothetical protein H1D32_06910 [Anaerobacillus sp. CMMVII]|uniref:hypothetical protein n=1 Tax=Anaerobacillus sp. CMMVII TaxID=2755588 RepID=UPI0021B7DC3C|nr:hypothetical protein [Anaerobacillus sp. CMMVII]MCT8137495.1 hypothetical protein [Anaerobacillus sp. CMMVII]